MFIRTIDKTSRNLEKGQSTVEYIILVAAVIGALILFLPGAFKTAYNNTLQSGTDGMEDMATRLSTSRGTQPTP